jgi:hypothetical protein
MWERRKRTPPAVPVWAYVLACLALVGLGAAVLGALGRPLACLECGLLWPENQAGQHASRSLADWYSASHVIYGMLIYWLMWRTSRHWPWGWLLVTAVAASVIWETVENTPWVIARFGAGPGGHVYAGDSIVNSVGDTLFVLAGFTLAGRLPVGATVGLAAFLEVAAALAIGDSLLLTTLNFILPSLSPESAALQ